ncbi:hypothetical protein [Deinococcus terrestris]|uniref:hypothetical protein n=1 Tax=Deinococcus terrestris TaxID=2651870 RepID=UPI001D1387FB|nr:hypothetical protein [Deinococcus terrestris]
MTTLPQAGATEVRDRRRVLTLSTAAFTLMFAVWLMFGIPGLPIRQEFGLTDVQLSWLTAVAVLNGSFWCLPAGIITDRHALFPDRAGAELPRAALPRRREHGRGQGRRLQAHPGVFSEGRGRGWRIDRAAGRPGRLLPDPMFAYAKNALGFSQRTFFAVFVMTLILVVWMQLTIMRMMNRAAPHLQANVDGDAVHS